MKFAAIVAVFIGLFYFFLPKKVEVVQIDDIKTKVSAFKRTPTAKTPRKKISRKAFVPTEEVTAEEESTEDSEDSNDIQETTEAAKSVPWNDIEQGWFTELKDQLVRLDPEEGEAIYTSYMNEKEKFQSEVDSLFKEKENITQKEAALEFDAIMSEIDRKHEDRLKEILGRHFDDVNLRHQEYLETVQQTGSSLTSENEEIAVPL